ncbi:hypothetical protein M8J75_013467 [Diaphorina citri]|nr:hypothetical protein M8J75_013467 [Diaphorina citri]
MFRQFDRIRNEKNGGAWCPKAQISSEVREYLEIDLSRNHLITLTETQGRFGNGQGQEYAEGFLIEYWRDTLNQWVVYNENGTKVKVKLRFRPFSWRFEITKFQASLLQ